MSLTLLPPPTKHGVLPEARRLVLPDGIVATGFPSVEATCAELGIRFDSWQRELLRCILAKRSDGDYAADTVAMSIPRQVGKTFMVGAVVFADSIIHPGTTTIWTAHRFKVSRETFDELRGWATSPALAAHIDPDDITTGAGNECITFRNGSRIVFAARERGAVRGFTKVRRLVLDEAQILTESALSDMVPTTNQAANPQIILMGTPPKPGDPSEVFTSMRREAMEGTSEDALWAEFGAEPGSDPDDRDAWREANPSYPKRTKTRAIQRMKRLLGEDGFRREALGIWDDDAGVCAISPEAWSMLEDADGERPSPVAFAVEVSPDRKWGSIHLAGRRPDGSRFVQMVESERGTAWVKDRVADLAAKWRPVAVAINPAGQAGSLLPALQSISKLPVVTVAGRDLSAACGMFADAVADGSLGHAGQTVLSVAVGAARWRHVGDARQFTAADRSVDIAPLWGVTLALFALERAAKSPARSGKVW